MTSDYTDEGIGESTIPEMNNYRPSVPKNIKVLRKALACHSK
jgi:hypothetical protein